MSDPIRFTCNCGKSLKADPKLSGKKAKCPRCGLKMRVPELSPPKSAAEARFDDDDIPVGMPVGKPLASSAPLPPPRPPNVPPRSQNSKPFGNDSDDLDLEPMRVSLCPGCGASMPAHAVVCLACGYNKQTGKGGKPTSPLPLQDSNLRSKSKDKSGKILLILLGVALVVVLGLGAFFAEGIAWIAGGVGLLLTLVGLGIYLGNGVGRFRETSGLTSNVLWSTLLLNLLTLPFGWVVIRPAVRGAPQKSQRLSNWSMILFGIGLLLIFVGVFAITMHQTNRRGQPARNDLWRLNNPFVR
jgi:hypothetical protein